MITKLWTIILAALVGVFATWHSSQSITTPSPQPSVSPVPTVTPKTPPLPKEDKLIIPSPLQIWAYPGSTSVGDSKWQSNDPPQVITNWYKDKIKSQGMNATSFVQTNTNDNILNKLVGANGSMKVSVEITRASGISQTSISVVLDK